jgi:hypothetical protein
MLVLASNSSSTQKYMSVSGLCPEDQNLITTAVYCEVGTKRNISEWSLKSFVDVEILNFFLDYLNRQLASITMDVYNH